MKTWLTIVICLAFSGCSSSRKMSNKAQVVNENPAFPTSIDPLTAGTPVFKGITVNYNRGGKQVLAINFKEPVVVSVASKPEKWGFFQFPSIKRNTDNSIGVKWNLNAVQQSKTIKEFFI